MTRNLLNPGCDDCDGCGAECSDYDCDDYDLEPCECVDFETGAIQTLTNTLLHLTGETIGGDSPPLPGTPSQTIPVVDYSGTYDFPIAVFDDSECSVTSLFHLIYKQFLGSSGGRDYWAIYAVRTTIFTIHFAQLIAAIADCDTGTEPDDNPGTTWFIDSIRSVWSFDGYILDCPGLFCLCPQSNVAITPSYSQPADFPMGLEDAGEPEEVMFEYVYA